MHYRPKTKLVTCVETNTDFVFEGWDCFIDVSVHTLKQARELVRKLVPLSKGQCGIIFIKDESCIVLLEALQEESELRCWNPAVKDKTLPALKFGEGLRGGLKTPITVRRIDVG